MANNFTDNEVVETSDVEISDKDKEKMFIQKESQNSQTTENILAYNFGKNSDMLLMFGIFWWPNLISILWRHKYYINIVWFEEKVTN